MPPEAKAFLPAPNAVPGMIPAGACNGAMSTAACLTQGKEAATEALKTLGLKPPRITVPKASDEAGSGSTALVCRRQGPRMARLRQ